MPTPNTPTRNDGRNDDPASTCPACGRGFTRNGRRRYCSDACRQQAHRRRHQSPTQPPEPPPGRPRRPVTVYACPNCDQRLLGQQRCPDCNQFCRAIGPGGCCPTCDEPIAITELTAP